MKTSRFVLVSLALVSLAVVLVTCHQSILIAPPGSSLTLIANPTFIPANTGVSVISALIYDGTGFPVADGTVVQFFTNLGRIEEQGRTNDGVARVNLYADSRSGTALVQAFSGSGSATTPSTPPTTNPSPGTGTATRKGITASLDASGSVEVRIGSATPRSVFVAANPQRITQPRFSTITATVFDENGNPVSNVPVFFTVDPPTDPNGPGLEEAMDSGGAPRFTDNSGRASDVLRTSYDPAARPKTVSVTATVPLGTALEKKVSVIIN